MTIYSENMHLTLASSLIRRIADTVARYEMWTRGECIVLGVSGGPDSLCMLHVLRALAAEQGISLHVGHLDHGIRGAEAEADVRFVAHLCEDWGVPCTISRADVPALAQARRLAIEEAARQARYAFLGELARSLDSHAVAVAHHADDQVETVLMHLLRGAGLAGLRGMRPVSWMDDLRLGEETLPPAGEPRERIRLLRPLLYIWRAEIETYCEEQGLRPRFDRSNLDRTYYRNRLRHELIPYLESYNPNIRRLLQRTAEALAGDYEVVRSLIRETWIRVVRQETDEAIIFDLAALRALPAGLQRSLLREAVHRLRFSLRNINWVHIDDAVRVLQHGQVGAMATLPRGLMLRLDYEVAIVAGEDYELPLEEWPRVQQPIAVPLQGETPLPDGHWLLRTTLWGRAALAENWATNTNSYRAYLDATRLAAPLALRPRRAGDWFLPLGLGRRQKVADLMINRKVPQHERDTWPLLVCGEDVVWIVGLHLDARYAVCDDTQRVLIVEMVKRGTG